jgi:copper homeostasis protein (lipoprotein)
MKKVILYISITLFLFSFSCNSQNKNLKKQQALAQKYANTIRNKIDWEGTYKGMLPCADCEGIQIELSVFKKGNYELTKRYEGKSSEIITEKGNFRWLPNGNAITLYSGNNSSEYTHFLVEENQLIKLDKEANRINSEFSELYILKKTGFDDRITERYWKLIELNGKPIESMPSNTQIHFKLKLIDSKVSGFAGCNRFYGHFELMQGQRIYFAKMMRTLIACKRLEIENQLLSQFDVVNSYTIKNDTLTLSKIKTKEKAKFVAEYFVEWK